MRLLKPFTVAFAGMVCAACDPCLGTPACDAPRIQYLGQVVHYQTGTPVPGVEITFESGAGTGGAATTDRAGNFLLSFPAEGEMPRVGRLRMHTPAGAAYVLEDVQLAPVRFRGDARALPRLTTEPILHRVWDIRRRGTAAVFPGGWAEFVHRGDLELEQDSVRERISDGGHWELRLQGPEQGMVTGEIRVWTPLGEYFTRTIAEPLDVWYPVPYLGPIYVGPWLGFGARLVRESGAPVAGATVTLRRTGGVQTRQAEHVITTNAAGEFPFDAFIVLEAGALELDILVTSGAEQLRAEGVQVQAEERDDYYFFGEIVVR